MSTALAGRVALDDLLGGLPTGYRALALAGAAVLSGTYLAALADVVDVVGGLGGLALFAAEVLAAVALGVGLARVLRLRYAVALGLALLLAGLGAYLLAIPAGAIDVERQLQDTVALLTGLSVLRMTKAGVWALGFTPGPLFVSTYLFARRQYGLGVLVGGGALAFFVSTSDVGVVHGLVGALGALAALGFGRLDLEGGTRRQRDTVVVLLVAVLVVTTSVSLVPGGQARPLLPGNTGNTVEASLLSSGDSVSVLGSIELSPEARFVVRAQKASRWRVGAFDRYTGDGWVRSGQSTPYNGSLPRPVATEVVRNRQTYQAQGGTLAMPAAWKPTRLESTDVPASVTSIGGLEPREGLEEGDVYTVISHEPVASPDALREAGTDYPEELVEQYTQLPESTPDRLRTFTSQLTADAENPYDTARVIERWLEANKQYSLNVDRPGGDVASRFVFDMEAGYCVYYATAMVSMLRTQGVPARFVVGYTVGEQVGDNQWVVRGLDSHAWVEVYFPEHGWIAFDPTPAGPRQEVEAGRLAQARAAGAGGVDLETPTPTPETPVATGPTPVGSPGVLGPDGPGGANGTPTLPAEFRGPGVGDAGGGGGGLGGAIPEERTVLYGLILMLGAATAAKRSGVFDRGRRLVWVRRRPDGAPAERVEGAFERLDYLLGRRYRPRRPGETPRAYLSALRSRVAGGEAANAEIHTGPHDQRVGRLFELYERARYAGRADEAAADRAWQLLGELRAEWSGWG